MLDPETLRMLDEKYAPLEKTATTISKATRAVIKLSHKIDQILPHNLSRVSEIMSVYLDKSESIREINRLLSNKWIVIAINQYTFKDGELQEWGTVIILGKY